MNKKIKPIRIEINDQKYLYKLIKEYPKIKSGRKNYYSHYVRVLKNLLLTNFFKKNIDDTEKIFSNKFKFNYNKTSIKINLDKKNKYL